MSRRAPGVLFHVSIGAVALFFSGCQGCLNLEEYTLVSTGGFAGSGGSTGTGGAPGCGLPGALYVTSAQPASLKQGDAGDPCAIPEDVDAGVELRAFDPEQRACLARARIVASPGTLLESPPRIHFDEGTSVHVAAIYREGALTMPASCTTGDKLVIEEDPSAEESLLVASLQRVGETFCTAWARRVFTTDVSAAKRLRVHSIRTDDAGQVAVVGSLGGAMVRFEDETASKDVTGRGFFARYSQDGGLGEVVALNGPDAADAVMDALPSGGRWLLTGAVQYEQPACHGCSGTVNVTQPAASSCPGAGGTGGTGGAGAGGTGTGGMTSTGGSGAGGMAGAGGASTGGTGGVGTGGTGAGGTGGAGAGGGMPAPDSRNAFLWPIEGSQECTLFQTFGSDRLGLQDSQAGFGMSVVPSSAGCSMVWAGLAGRDAWRLKADSLGTALFDAGGASMDGFVARSEGPNALCNSAPGPVWNVRVTPLAVGAAAVTERASVARCSFGEVTASALVRSPAGGNVALYRCETEGGCDTDASLVPLPAAGGEHLLIMGLRSNGQLDWSAAFGPLSADPDAGSGSFTGRSHHDLARDSEDRLYAVFTTTGPLATRNVEPLFDCDGLAENLAEGTYLVSLRPYSNASAMCEWFERIGP